MDAMFEKAARYRCEQTNVTRLNEQTVTFSAEIKTLYLTSVCNENTSIKRITLEEYIYAVDPSHFNDGLDFAKNLEENVKRTLVIGYSPKGIIDRVYNLDELAARWQRFKTHTLPENTLYRTLVDTQPAAAQDIITTGDSEFSSESNVATTLDKNLFFHILTRSYPDDALEDYTLRQNAQLFPNLALSVRVKKSKISDDNGVSTYVLKGVLERDFLPE